MRRVDPSAPAPRPASRPLAGRIDRSWIAPALAAVGLAIVAVLTAGLFGGRLPFDLPGGVVATARPTPNQSIVIPTKKTEVRGTVLFAKNGNIWSASGTDVQQLSRTGRDSSPAWSADGQWIYLIETRTKDDAFFPYQGTPARFVLRYPVIVRMHPDGTGRKDVASSLYTSGPGKRYTYHVWYLEPAPDPKGGRIAILSDGPPPPDRDPIIQLMPATGGKLTSLNLPYTIQLGLADPTWRPDGAALAYTRYDRTGFEPAHKIAIYTFATKKVKVVTGPGYSQPAWSPDGRYLAVVRWSAAGRDIVIIDATSGSQVLAVTNDGHSWAPSWSPGGDAIVYLSATGEDLDLEMAVIRRSGSTFNLGEKLPITEESQLDGTSRPSWYVPPDQLPTPAPSSSVAPAPSGTGAASGSAGASATP